MTTPLRRPRATALPGFALAACANLETAPGPDRPDAELAIVEGYFRFYFLFADRADITAVDGKRVAGFPWSVPTVRLVPGHHRLEITIQRCFGGGGGYTECAFEADFAAGHHYQLVAHSGRADRPWYEHLQDSYTGTIAMDIAVPGQPSRRETLATVCASGLPRFCRQDNDCPEHPRHTYRCQPANGTAFGIRTESGER